MAVDEMFWREIQDVTWLQHLYLISVEDMCNNTLIYEDVFVY